MPTKRKSQTTTRQDNKDDHIQLDQVFLGIVVGMLLTAVIIGVITFVSVQEANQQTLEKLKVIQERLDTLDNSNENIEFPN